MSRGVHEKKPPASPVSAGRRAAAMAVLITVCTVAIAVTLAVFAVRVLVTLLIRGAVTGWRHLPPAGRVIAGTVVAFGTADLASMLGLIPPERWAILLAGGAISTFYGAWLIGWQRVGQREWAAGKVKVMHGGRPDLSPETVAQYRAAFGEMQRRLDELERRNAELDLGLLAAAGDAGPRPAAVRHLRVVGDDSGPMPKISLPAGCAAVGTAVAFGEVAFSDPDEAPLDRVA